MRRDGMEWVTLVVVVVTISIIGWISQSSRHSELNSDVNGDGIADELQTMSAADEYVVRFDRPVPNLPNMELRGYGGPACPDADGDGYTTCAGDCDDGWHYTNPGVAEWCDPKGVHSEDNDCDGLVDQKDPDCAAR